MPSTSKKQHDFMEAVAHNKAFAKKVGVPQSVGQDFSKADKGRKFSKGGSMPVAPRTPVAPRITTGLPPVQMKSAPAKAPAPAVRTTTTAPQKGMPSSLGPKYYAKGGSASARADGVAQKGKTKGKNLGNSGKTVKTMSGARRGK